MYVFLLLAPTLVRFNGAADLHVCAGAVRAFSTCKAAPRAGRALASASAQPSLVWFSGAADLRVDDNAGLLAASAGGTPVVCAFVLDETAHLARAPAATVLALHAALVALETRLAEYGAALAFSVGDAPTLLPTLAKDLGAGACFVAPSDPCATMRTMQCATEAALAGAGVDVVKWNQSLRPSAPWEAAGSPLSLPRRHDAYAAIASAHTVAPPLDAPDSLASLRLPPSLALEWGRGVPDAATFLQLASEATSPALGLARTTSPTTQPHASAAIALAGEDEARRALGVYCSQGRSAFARRYLRSAASPLGAASMPGALGRSLYASAAEWIEGSETLAERGALREAACVGFRSSLALGSLSQRRYEYIYIYIYIYTKIYIYTYIYTY